MWHPAKLYLGSALTGAIGCVATTSIAADELIDRLRVCVAEANDAKRLICYDAALGRGDHGAVDDIGVTGELLRSERREAGLTAPAPASPPQDMSAKVLSVIELGSGKFVVTLDNGQIWSQQEALDFAIKPGDVVTVRRGVLGALWMSNGRGHLQTRVQRVH